MSAKPQVAPAIHPQSIPIKQLWSCIGSAGIVNLDDMENVEFSGAIVKLRGTDPTKSSAKAKVESVFPEQKIQAVIRYELEPVRGLLPSNLFGMAMQIYGRRGSGDIQAKLIAVTIPTVPTAAPTETPLITYIDQNTDRLHFITDVSPSFDQMIDFVNNSFYIELTLSAVVRIGAILVDPPEVAAIHLVATKVVVPDVLGLVENPDARDILRQAWLNSAIAPPPAYQGHDGKVTGQDPDQGKIVPRHSTVTLTLIKPPKIPE